MIWMPQQSKVPGLQRNLILISTKSESLLPAGSTYISAISPEIEEILKKLWSFLDISVPLSIMQMKIYTLALFFAAPESERKYRLLKPAHSSQKHR